LIKLLLICFVITIIYLYRIPTTKSDPIQSNVNQTRIKAYLITHDCNSFRFITTKANIERVFPEFFNIICHLHVPLSDPRIHLHTLQILKDFSSNLLTFLDLWTYIISNTSKNDFEWTFIFEDDVNFNDPSTVSLPNYIAPLQQLMDNREIQQKDGFFYLGICEPTFDNDSQPLISNDKTKGLESRKGCGTCLHASAITTNRSGLFWAEVSSYRPNLDSTMGNILQDYCVRSRNSYYILGTNFLYPPGTRHCGIAYQDRGKFQ
jgi:hypothetical protein